MAYIGQRPVIGRYIKLDQISSGFNGSNTGFSMTAGSQAVFPGTARNLLLSLGGVIQEPDTDFTISGSTLTFTTPPVANTTFFGVIYGDMQATGTPSDGTVLPASIASSGHFKIPQLTVNEDGADVDFRVEGDTEANLLFVDASTDRIGMGTNSPGALLHLQAATPVIRFTDSDTSRDSQIVGIDGNLRFDADNNDDQSGTNISFKTDNVERLKIDSTELVVNDTGASVDFRVEGDTLTHLLFVDASADKVGIGVSNPSNTLEISGTFQAAVAANTGSYTQGFNITNAVNADFNVHLKTGSTTIGPSTNTPLCFHIGGTANEKMRLDTSGRLIVGDTSSASSTAMLQTKRANNNTILISNSDATATNFTAVDFAPANSIVGSRIVSKAIGTFGSSAAQTADLFFETIHQGTSAKRLYIDSTGLVGIGTDAPGSVLHVDKGLSGSPLVTFHQTNGNSSADAGLEVETSSTGTYIQRWVNSGDEKMRVTGNGLVGIGATSPSVPLNVVTAGTDAALFESTSGDANGVQLSLRATSASPADNDKLAVLDFSGRDDAGNNTTYAQIRSHSRDVSNGSEDGDITFHTRSNGSFDERVRIKSDGNVSILGGHLDFANGYGIDFGATSNSGGSMSSELLDDYEEGTWTPILTDDGTSGNSASSYTHQLGWYTKVGNIVNLQCRISGANTTGFNTPHSAFIKNLPFAIKGSSNRLVIGSLMLSNVNLDSDTMGIGILANVGAGSGSDNYHFRLFQTKDNAVWGDIEISQIPSGNHEIQVNFTYRAA